MKRRIYLRIAQGTSRVEASGDSKARPIMTNAGQYSRTIYYPTIEIPILIDIPEDAFPKGRKAIEVKVKDYNLCDEIIIKPEEINETGGENGENS